MVGERHSRRAIDDELALSNHVHQLDASEDVGRCVKGLKPNVGLVTRLITRWSCSTILFRYLTCRIVIGTAKAALISSIAALLAPL